MNMIKRVGGLGSCNHRAEQLTHIHMWLHWLHFADLHSSIHLSGFVATPQPLSKVCQFCRISATITDAVRSCPQTLHLFGEAGRAQTRDRSQCMKLVLVSFTLLYTQLAKSATSYMCISIVSHFTVVFARGTCAL